MHIIKKAMLLFGFCLIIGTSVSAQNNRVFAPFERLFFHRAIVPAEQYARWEADIYSWAAGEREPHRETTTGWADTPVVSPDGSKVVYTQVAQGIIDLLERGENYPYGGAPEPTDIWVIDTSKPLDDPARHVQIADQFTGLPDADTPFQIRSTPVWSPDSTRLAWIELHEFSTMFAGRIMVYDMRTGETTQIAAPVSLGYADGGEFHVPSLEGWGDGVLHYSSNAGIHPDSDNSFGVLMDTFDENGLYSRAVVTYWTDRSDSLDSAVWVRDGSQWLVYLSYLQTGSVLFNPRADTYAQPENPPVVGSILGGSRTWINVLDADAPPDRPRIITAWTLNESAGESQPPPTLRFRTFDPAGEPVFYDRQASQLVYWSWANAETIPVLPGDHDPSWRDSIATWVPGMWRVTGETTPIEPLCCALATQEAGS